MKKHLISMTMLGILLIGCSENKKADTTNAAASSSTAQTPAALSAAAISVPATTVVATSAPATISTNTDTTAAAAIIDQLMNMMGNSLVMANKMTQQSQGKPKFTPDQVNCMATTGNDAAVQNMQAWLQQNFNDTELQQLNTFYASPSAKKQAEMTKNMIAAIVKDPKDIPKVQLTTQETTEITAFWQSPTGAKLAALLKDKEKLRPMMTKIIDKKQVDCHLPPSKA